MHFPCNSLLRLKSLHTLSRHCHTKIKPSVSSFNREDWISVIGLEIHAQLSTGSKLFSCAPAVYGAPTNSVVELFDAAVPGTLPILNKEAVKLAVISSLALGCKVNPLSYFERKHYFYSDLPAGFQITQQKLPLAVNGKVEYAIFQPGIHKQPYYKTCRIKQIQLEQDSGKSLHENTEKQSYIDLNRAGIALIEIVFHPDINDAEEACALIKEVISILERVKSCSCKLEEGALRVDANVSVKKHGDDLGVRTEIKNIGSVHGVSNAIKYEVERQINLISNGVTIKNETLAWDSLNNKTIIMRDKEEKQDYRFMPEPNLLPLRVVVDEYSENFHKNARSKLSILNFCDLKEKLPDLPQKERLYLKKNFGLSDILAYNLVNQHKLFIYFKEIMTENSLRDPKVVYSLLMYQLLNILKSKSLLLDDCEFSAKYLGQIVDLLQTKRISKNTIGKLLEELLKNDSVSPFELVETLNLGIISNPKELKKICLKVMEREEAMVVSYKRRKKKAEYNALMSKVIEESKFRADTQVLPKLLTELLNEVDETNK